MAMKRRIFSTKRSRPSNNWMPGPELPARSSKTNCPVHAIPGVRWRNPLAAASGSRPGTAASLVAVPAAARTAAAGVIVRQFTRGERLALVVQQRFVTPTGHRQLFFQADRHLVRPYAADFGVGDPWHLFQLRAHAGQVDGKEARRQVRADALLYRLLADVTQVALHADLGDRPVGIRQQTLRAFIGSEPSTTSKTGQYSAFRKPKLAFGRRADIGSLATIRLAPRGTGLRLGACGG
ncbi:hypothetical protein Ddc_21162 [Ditylenchus destructor]|nr:hypothetical protein Ddc_21162 [Ditylenchus destructor]